MDALAQMIPPGAPKAVAGLLPLLIFFELQAMITSSMPSPAIMDQPSSLKPLIASLKPLEANKIDVIINSMLLPKKGAEDARVISLSKIHLLSL